MYIQVKLLSALRYLTLAVAIRNLVIWCVIESDLYWSGEVGCGTSITLETGRDNWRGQTKHKILRVAVDACTCIISACTCVTVCIHGVCVCVGGL